MVPEKRLKRRFCDKYETHRGKFRVRDAYGDLSKSSIAFLAEERTYRWKSRSETRKRKEKWWKRRAVVTDFEILERQVKIYMSVGLF